MEFTEKSLLELGGWQVFREAKSLVESGRVSEARFEEPSLRGIVQSSGKRFPAGLRFGPGKNIDNLCPCKDSQFRGILCAHSIAVGLAYTRRSSAQPNPQPPPAPMRPAHKQAGLEETSEAPQIALAFEGSLRHLEAEITFSYTRPGTRNTAAEMAALSKLSSMGFEDRAGKAVLAGEEKILNFFSSGIPALEREWRLAPGERFSHVTRDLVRITPRFQIRERGDGWLDFQVHYSAGQEAIFSRADLNRLLAGGTKQIPLKNGRTAIPDRSLESDIEEVLRDCDPRQNGDLYRVAPRHLAYLESSVAGWNPASDKTPSRQPSPPKLGSLEPALRPYQKDGARWLLGLARAGLGGLLADEMGLGKTVQALALAESLEGTSLVVCPSSLVWNWASEAARFLPSAKILALDGPKRAEKFPGIASAKIAITSYALLRRDIDNYRAHEFAAVILDEAQHIKNPGSQNAKAAAALRARSRFVLTGTPVENSLGDLWSLFDFLLPGYLGTREDFKSRYEDPLLGGERGPLWARLNRRTGPYILRRRKADLLTELPDKIEQVVSVELDEMQKAVYTQVQRAAREQVDALGKSSGGAARMRALTALLRLRQACCDLRLIGSPKPGSAKLAALRELLEEAIDGGHRTLVFSQFTSMLDLIAADLDGAGIRHCRLDGQTRDRAAAVATFQDSPDIPVFLISLKAGGVGLNLTAADTVIHFDPWWNPAAEAQATDRAHRIGQKNVVTSIKLICRDTVEERVLQLQESKKELFAGSLDPEAAFSKLADSELKTLLES